MVISRQSNSNGSSLNVPKIKTILAFTQVLVTNNFDDTSIKIELARMETSLSHYMSMGYFSNTQGKLIRSKWFDLADIETHPRF